MDRDSPGNAAALPNDAQPPAWRLDDLYTSIDAPEIARDLGRAEEGVRRFKADYAGKLVTMSARSDAGVLIHGAVKIYENLSELTGKLSSFAGLSFAAQSSDTRIAKFYGDMQAKLTSIGADMLFFELELSKIAENDLQRALKHEGLKAYAPWLANVRAFTPHQLPEELERLLFEKDLTGAGAFGRLFEETMAGLRFEVEGKALTGPEALHLLSHPDKEMRARGAKALSETFGANIRTFTFILNTLVKDKEIDDRWRRYSTPGAFRNLSNQVEPDVVNALVTAVRNAYPQLSHRYYAMKARWLGQERLNFWDRNAPLPVASERKIGWADARSLVLDAYQRFSPDMASIGRQFFDKAWIDAEPRAGKTGGAFSHPTVPSAHPYILMSYLGSPRDVMTLAHELGHGVHQVLAADQGALMAVTPLTLAETASVFGEMLTFRAMLAQEKNPRERMLLIAAKVEDMLNTVVRQIAFYTFEERLHAARREGELTAEDIGRIWLSVQSESLGPTVELNPGYEHFWCYIPHFVRTPFYVYAYAFGDCLVNSLYALYENAAPDFGQRYLDLLRAGGSKRHKELLAPFELDASDPAFWQKGLSLIARFIGELENASSLLMPQRGGSSG